MMLNDVFIGVLWPIAQPIDVNVTNTWDVPTLTTVVVSAVAGVAAAIAAWAACRSVTASVTAAERLMILEFMRTYASKEIYDSLVVLGGIYGGSEDLAKAINEKASDDAFKNNVRVIKNYFFQAASAYEVTKNKDGVVKDVVVVWGVVLMFQVVQWAEYQRNKNEEYWWKVLRKALATKAGKMRLAELGIDQVQLPGWGVEPKRLNEVCVDVAN